MTVIGPDRVSYRASPRWIVYPFVVVMTAIVIAGFGAAVPHVHGGGEWILVALVLIVGLSIPVSLLRWNRRLGVYATDFGITSVGYSRTIVIPWGDIVGFSVDRYRAGTITVFADRADGSHVGLYAVQGWPYQCRRVERFRAALEQRRLDRLQRPTNAE